MLGRLGKFCRRAILQLIAGPTAPNTLETFVPTERIDAMAATAINEAISVYSTTVAPWVFFIRRRKKDNIGFSGSIQRGMRPSDGAVAIRTVLGPAPNVNQDIRKDH